MDEISEAQKLPPIEISLSIEEALTVIAYIQQVHNPQYNTRRTYEIAKQFCKRIQAKIPPNFFEIHKRIDEGWQVAEGRKIPEN